MGLFGRIKEAFAAPRQLRRQLNEARGQVHAMRAKVDAAQTTAENRNHWANADSFGPNSAFDPNTRFNLRNRARYETLNNSYCRGLVRSLAYDLIGTGPRLQLNLTASMETQAKQVEKRFAKWARAVCLGAKYRLLEKCSARDGEGFALLDTNDRVKDSVKLDLRTVEADLCSTPFGFLAEPYMVDGVRCDKNWDPIEYYFLTIHPGETLPGLLQSPYKWITVPAAQVLHWFEKDRAGQVRGIPKITSSLPLFAQLRRYTIATVMAAEVAAMLAGIMQTNVPAGENPPPVDAYDLISLVRGALLTLPDGWDAKQFKPEQPTTTYGDFKREILNEAGRGPGAPLNVVSGNSSGYNYSSGRLDHLPYQRGLTIDRDEFRSTVLDRVLAAWFEEAALIPDYLPVDLPPIDEWEWSWNWDGFDSIDQNKDANADDVRIKNGTQTYAETYAAYGQDWQAQFDQLAREKAYAESLGLPWPVLAVAQKDNASGGSADPNSPPDDSSPEDQPPSQPPSRHVPSRNGYHRVGGGP